jgi:hypothetical protein
MAGYGAVENRPKSGVVAGAVAGVGLLVVVVASVVYYQTSERRKADASDYQTLDAEHDALKAAAAPLGRLAELAKPETPPADYAAALAEARASFERYVSPPRRAKPLPSGRAWPGQFAAADELLKSALDHFGMVTYYLDLRAKSKPSKVSGTANIDADINNLASDATTALTDLQEALSRMQAQRDAHAWEYGPAPKASKS